jgi:hypothetical protein
LGAFDEAFHFEAATAIVAAALSLGLGRVRVRAPITTPTTEAA